MSGRSVSAVAGHTLLAYVGGACFAVSVAQKALLARALATPGGKQPVRGAAIRSARSLAQLGLVSMGCNADGEHWVIAAADAKVAQ